MGALSDFFKPRTQLLTLEKEVKMLRAEVDKLRAQNNSMKAGMRRCITCEYRIDFKERQGEE